MRIGEKSGFGATGFGEKVGTHLVRPPKHVRLRDGGDSVPVVDVARAFARLLGRVDDGRPDPARAAQVEILRNAVASGRYQPDLNAVARKLLVAMAAEPRV